MATALDLERRYLLPVTHDHDTVLRAARILVRRLEAVQSEGAVR